MGCRLSFFERGRPCCKEPANAENMKHSILLRRYALFLPRCMKTGRIYAGLRRAYKRASKSTYVLVLHTASQNQLYDSDSKKKASSSFKTRRKARKHTTFYNISYAAPFAVFYFPLSRQCYKLKQRRLTCLSCHAMTNRGAALLFSTVTAA